MIRGAKQDDIAALRALWWVVFNDSERFLDRFFAHLFVPENCLVAECEGRITSMLFLLEATASCRQGNRPLRYVYACATHPDFRKQGFMGQLLNTAIEYADENGFDLILIPANEPLFDYYKRFGFTQPTYLSRCSYPPIAASAVLEWVAVGSSDIAAAVTLLQELRTAFFERTDAVLWLDAHIKVMLGELFSQKGEMLVLKTGGYALTLLQSDGTVDVIECASQLPREEMIASLRAHYSVAKTTFSLPSNANQPCAETPYGLLYSKQSIPLYLNLGLE